MDKIASEESPVSAASAEEILNWLITWVAKEVKVDPAQIDVDEPFVNFGLTSRQAVLLSGDLEDWLGVELEPSLVWDFPTIAKLSAHLAGS